jgi:hypothetical protein
VVVKVVMDNGDAVVGRRLRVEIADVDRWSRTYLAAGIDAVLFCDGYLSTVLGVELTSGAQIVVKIRTDAGRLHGCAAVHRQLFERGFPCPEPILDLEPMDGLVASAEAMMRGGNLYPRSGRSPVPFASALARLVSLAPLVAEVPSLEPPPPWTAPDLGAAVLWPAPDDRDVDLNSVGGPEWIDEAGRAAKTRLAASGSPLVVGHADWYTGNLRWRGDDLYAVWDWDSVIAALGARHCGPGRRRLSRHRRWHRSDRRGVGGILGCLPERPGTLQRRRARGSLGGRTVEPEFRREGAVGDRGRTEVVDRSRGG